MNKAASSSFADVDMVIWLVEALKWTKEDERVLDHLSNVNIPVILCVNKVDTLNSLEQILPFLETLGEKFEANDVSRVFSFLGKFSDFLHF